eukprot:6325465-Prymnesium_polylepis.1
MPQLHRPWRKAIGHPFAKIGRVDLVRFGQAVERCGIWHAHAAAPSSTMHVGRQAPWPSRPRALTTAASMAP